MRVVQIFLSAVLLCGLLTGVAMAEGTLQMSDMRPGIIPTISEVPQGGGNMTDEYADSIGYCTFPSYWHYTGTGTLYAQMRVTAPADFTMQGISCYIDYGANFTSATNVYVFQDNNGNPGTSLYQSSMFPTPIIVNEGGYLNFEFSEDDWINFTAGDEFWIVVRFTLGTTGYCVYFDNDGNTGNRNYYGFSANVTNTAISGDWEMWACGDIAGEFYDIRANYAQSDNNAFHQFLGTTITLSAEVENIGIMDSEAGTLVFTVKDDDDNTVFTSTEVLNAIGPGGTAQITSSIPWTPSENVGRYVLTAEAILPDDADGANNSTMLLQQVVGAEDWYRYDDDTNEGSVVYNVGAGAGPLITPPGFPATLDSVSFYFAAAGSNVTLLAWDLQNYAQIWTYTGNVAEGWNSFAVDPPVTVTSDGFALIQVYDGTTSLAQDNEPPVSAANQSPSMNDAGIYYDGADLYYDDTGNWMMQAKISANPPADVDIIFPPLVTNIGETPVGTPLTYYLPFSNEGSDDGHITQIQNTYPQLVIPAAANLPITIPAGGDYDLELIWTPTAEGPTNMGFQVTHDDPEDNNPFIIGLTGNALASVAYTDPTIPNTYYLEQNKPNPFNPETTIRFGLKAPGHATLTVYNLMGQEVRTLIDEELTPGSHTVLFNASDLPSGVYFYSLRANDFTSIQKMVLMK